MLLATADMSGLETIFIACAALGGGLFLIRLVLFMLGGFGEADADVDVGDVGDVDVGDVDAADIGDVAETAASFRLLTLQGLTAFLGMFGLVGLALFYADTGGPIAVLGGFAAGAASLLVITKLMTLLLRLQSSGTINLANAVGQEGTVYLTIPADGTGKVQVAVQERLMVLDTVSEDKREMKTGERVKVVRVVAGRTLSVRKT